MSPRAYQARVDACRLWDLKLQGASSAEIARKMGKDPAWVCRTLKKIEDDFSVVYQRPKEAKLIDDHLARLEVLYSKASKLAEESTGMAQVAAYRTVSSILRERLQFLQYVGMIAKNDAAPEDGIILRGGLFS